MTHGAQLDECQVKCSDLEVTVSDVNKMIQFVEQIFESSLFPQKFMNDWEDTPTATYTRTIKNFATEFDKIWRMEVRKAESAGGSMAAPPPSHTQSPLLPSLLMDPRPRP